jgi:hypothetical protein
MLVRGRRPHQWWIIGHDRRLHRGWRSRLLPPQRRLRLGRAPLAPLIGLAQELGNRDLKDTWRGVRPRYQLQRLASPCLSWSRKALGLGGAWGNALKWSIIGLAREHPNARISRQQGGHCRWQVAAGGNRMWPTCAMRWSCRTVVLAGRSSVALTGSRHRRYPRSSLSLQLPAWSLAPGLWSKLWGRVLSVSQIDR